MTVSINGTTGLITAGSSSSGGGGIATNTALGGDALVANTTGASNTAIGNEALKANTTASYNTAVGYQANYTNTTGNYSSTFGYLAGYSQTTGTQNTALGSQTLYTNSTGSYNTAVGYQANYGGTGSYNCCFGVGAGIAFTSGAENTLVGYYAGGSLTTGNKNLFIGGAQGSGSGGLITTGNSNVVIGSFSGNQNSKDIRTSSNNIVLSDGDGNVPLICISPDNAIWQFNAKAAGAYAGILQFCVDFALKSEVYHDDALDRFTIQNDSGGVYLASGGTSWTSMSDERLKNITGEIQNGLSKVCTLRAAEYTWKSDESAKPQVGLIAQDVLAVLPEAVEIPPEGSTVRDGSPAMMGVSYTETIPLLVAAIKELNAKVTALEAQLGAK